MSLINEYISFLDTKKDQITEKKLKDDFSLFTSVAYVIQVIIQTSIDISVHIASDEKWELPNTSARAFEILARHKVISNDLSEELQKAARFRNVLVHQYDTLDYKVIADITCKKLPLFISFGESINSWMKKQ